MGITVRSRRAEMDQRALREAPQRTPIERPCPHTSIGIALIQTLSSIRTSTYTENKNHASTSYLYVCLPINPPRLHGGKTGLIPEPYSASSPLDFFSRRSRAPFSGLHFFSLVGIITFSRQKNCHPEPVRLPLRSLNHPSDSIKRCRRAWE